jgi:hypothetical protein
VSRPVVANTAEQLYAALGPFTVGDEDQDWHLLKFCDAICTVCLERIYELAADRDGRPGWQAVFDPEASPAYALAYLAQFVGTTLEPQWSEAEQRLAIQTPEGWGRGRPATMVQAIKRTLTGTQSVTLTERDGDAYALTVSVLSSEEPSASETLRAAISQKPIGLVLTFAGESPETWADVDGEFATWAAVEAGNEAWIDVQFAGA